MKLLAVLLIVMMTSACDIFGLECKTYLIFGLTVTLVDSATAIPVQSDSITVVATSGSYSDSATIVKGSPNWEPTVVLVERAGTFTVKVSATGYRPWIANSVRIQEADRCGHLRNVRLTARMQR